jgi:hypothetical protein
MVGGSRLGVSFLYYEECPSHDLALERLREVMAEDSGKIMVSYSLRW